MNQPGHGIITAFYHQNELCFAIITDSFKEQFSVCTPTGLILQLPAKRFVLISQASYDLSDPTGTINDFSRQCSSISAGLDVHKLADDLLSHGQSFSFEQICQALGMKADHERFALYARIKRHPEIFAFKHDLFSIRNAAEQESYQRQLLAQESNKLFLQRVQKLVNDLSSKGADPGSDLDADFRAEFLQKLKHDLIERENSDLIKLIRSQAREEPWEKLIHRIRLYLKDVNPQTDKVLSVSGLEVCHPDNIAPDFDSGFCREDATHLQTFSIDDEDTSDIDDAISWQSQSDGFLLGIHISDVTARIASYSQLFQEARTRVSSLYLPTEIVPMFPLMLSSDTLSLKAGTIRPALSLFVEYNQDFEPRSSRFALTNIKIATNYSYKEVDKLLSQKTFAELSQLQRKLKGIRNQEADNLHNRFSYQINASTDRIRLKRIDNASPSRNLVRELMILYNRSFAEYTFKYQLPAIYRNIEQYLQDAKDPESAVISSSAYLSTKPDYHPGIGSEAYMHASSPIRRFTDLVNQYQVCNHLGKGQALFDDARLQTKIAGIEKILLLQREVISSSNRYWFLVYLSQNYLHQALKATIVKTVKSGFIAELRDWNRKVQVCSDAYYKVGEEILLIPMEIDPEAGLLRAEVIQ